MRLFYDMKRNFYNVFTFTYVSITDTNKEHYMEGVII